MTVIEFHGRSFRSDNEAAPRRSRFVEGYTEGRSLGRALFESLATVGAMALVFTAIALLRLTSGLPPFGS